MVPRTARGSPASPGWVAHLLRLCPLLILSMGLSLGHEDASPTHLSCWAVARKHCRPRVGVGLSIRAVFEERDLVRTSRSLNPKPCVSLLTPSRPRGRAFPGTSQSKEHGQRAAASLRTLRGPELFSPGPLPSPVSIPLSPQMPPSF